MIKTTIEKHFEKEAWLFDKDIKTLSLFFIPVIHDFRGDNPRIKDIFEEEYKTQRKAILAKTNNEAYKSYLMKGLNKDGQLQVYEGYFSGDKVSTKDKKGEF